MTKALIAMSGGVDSSVAALLMKDKGYDCVGVTMKLYQNEDIEQEVLCDEHTCCSLDDVEDARSVAHQLSMPYYVFNFSDRFRECVMDPFVRAYESGATPNPCIDCNRHLKFTRLFARALELKCDYVVTGHYARIERDETSGRYLLKKAVDASKDQSYVLYNLTQEQLAHVLFPLGGFTKAEIREMAEQNSFINSKKQDSQDICFVPNGKYAEFIEHYTGKTYPEGDFVSIDGKVLGKHRGIIRYTIGQRKGLYVSSSAPLYVCRVEPESNTVVLGSDADLWSKTLTATDINLISVPDLYTPMRVKAKVRYRHTEQWATAVQLDEDTIRVEFDEPQRAITKGQSVVLYDGDTVVGGGRIV